MPPPRPIHTDCFIWDIGSNIGSNKNPYGISKIRLVCFSEQERGIEHSSSYVCASMMSLWKRSCGSTWTSSPSILTNYFVPRVTTWSFRLKVCSSPVFPSIDFSMAAPTECAVSTLTVGWACSPVAMFRMLKSLLKGFRSCRYRRTATVSSQSRTCLALLISSFCSPVLYLTPVSSCVA